VSELPKKSTRDLKRLSASLALLALQRLADPEVRAQLAKHSRTLADNAREWRAERAAGASGPIGLDPALVEPGGTPVGDDLRLAPATIADRFGRRRLQRRIDRLRVSVLALGEGRPELAVQLDPVLAALEEVGSALDVAAALALPRRMRAHLRVDQVLDQLEVGLFEAALPQLPRPSDPAAD
jgi:hypothetical protein